MALVSTRSRVGYPGKIRRLSRGIRKEARRQHASNVLGKSTTATATITICVTFDNIDFELWDKPLWGPHAFRLSTTEPLRSLPFLFEALVQQRSSKDEHLSQTLLDGLHVLKLSSNIVQPRICSNVVISLDEDPRIELLGDLFQNPRAPELVLLARVKLTIQENSQESTPSDERIQHSRWHDVTDDYRVLRIGSVPLRNGDEAEMAEKVWDHRREGIAYMQALTAWMDRKSGDFHLRRCHAFGFDDFCIGNALEDTQWNQRAFINRDYFLGRLENVRYRQGSKEDFVKLLEQLLHDEDEEAQMGSGIPFLPTYCYNEYQAAEMDWACCPGRSAELMLLQLLSMNMGVSATSSSRKISASLWRKGTHWKMSSNVCYKKSIDKAGNMEPTSILRGYSVLSTKGSGK